MKKSRRPRRKGASKYNVRDEASCSVTRTVAISNMNQMYAWRSFALADFPRAVQIAKAYQHYRITGIKLTFKPAYDTYAQGGVLQKPNLYYIIDKGNSIPDGVTLEALKQMGARPHAYDEKPIHITWRPSVLTEDLGAGGAVPVQYKVSPWLSTNDGNDPALWNPSRVSHLGLKWYMEQPGGNSAVYVEAELQFQFKKPLLPALAAQPALGLTYAIVDASPDGVQGGTDGITVPLESA